MQTIQELVNHFHGNSGQRSLSDADVKWLIAEGTLPFWYLYGEGEDFAFYECEDCGSCWFSCCCNIEREGFNLEDSVYWHYENLDRLERSNHSNRGPGGKRRRHLTVKEAIEKLNHRFVLWSKSGARLDRLVRVSRVLGMRLDWQETALLLQQRTPIELAQELRVNYRRRSLKSLLSQLHDMDLAIAGLIKKWRGPVASAIRNLVLKSPQNHKLYRFDTIASVARLSRVAKQLQQVRAIDMSRLKDRNRA